MKRSNILPTILCLNALSLNLRRAFQVTLGTALLITWYPGALAQTTRTTPPEGPVDTSGITESADWVRPTYPTTQPAAKRITAIDHYVYRESKYDPPITLQPLPKANARYDTPEAAMLARASAMTALDYEWWLSTWDPVSRQLVLERDQALGRTSQYWLNQWGVMQTVRMTLQRRIEVGGHVVLTYYLTAPDGKDVGGFEFPAVLRQIGGRWFSTQDLAQNPLLPYSPWVTGQTQAEATVR